MSRRDVVHIEEVVLQKLKLNLQSQLSEERMEFVARSLEANVELDRMRRSFYFRIQSFVLGRYKTDRWEFVEQPTYPTWKHQLIDSLPQGFRRRFLSYFFDIKDEKLGRRVLHVVEVKVGIKWPYADVPMPEEFGAHVPYVTYTDDQNDFYAAP